MRPRHDDSTSDGSRTSETARIEAFSDGVFAVAITLLVLDFKVPESAAGDHTTSLWSLLALQWPTFVGYAISFAMIGIMWANHSNIYRYITRSNHTFVMLNIMFLFFVCLLPFPTALLARYLAVPVDRVTATTVYCGTLLLNGLAFNGIWLYAAHGGRLLAPDADPDRVRSITREFVVGPMFYGLATAIALVNVAVSLTIVAGLAILYLRPSGARR